MRSRRVAMSLLAALAFSLVNVELAQTHACDNPVYRYALQNWPPAEFELLLVKLAELADQEAAAWQSLQESVSAAGSTSLTAGNPRPNLRLRVVSHEEVAALPDGPLKDRLAAL